MRAAVPRDEAPRRPSAEIQAELVHDMLYRQYLLLTDQLVPMLASCCRVPLSRSAAGQR